jgi:hypothetical protein
MSINFHSVGSFLFFFYFMAFAPGICDWANLPCFGFDGSPLQLRLSTTSMGPLRLRFRGSVLLSEGSFVAHVRFCFFPFSSCPFPSDFSQDKEENRNEINKESKRTELKKTGIRGSGKEQGRRSAGGCSNQKGYPGNLFFPPTSRLPAIVVRRNSTKANRLFDPITHRLPIGGRNSKLSNIAATTEAPIPYRNPPSLAITSTDNKRRSMAPASSSFMV